MTGKPSDQVVSSIEAGNAFIVRRVEFYEADGTTRWYPNGDPVSIENERLIGGSVSVDYSRDERRTLDLELLNEDNLLRQNPYGGLWYDKVIKVFRGITFDLTLVQPRIAIIETDGSSNAEFRFASLLGGIDYTNVTVELNATDPAAFARYDIIISFTGANASAKSSLLQALYNSGKKIVTISTANDGSVLPFVTATSSTTGAATWGITPVTTDNPLSGSFTTEAATPDVAGVVPTGLGASALQVAKYSNSQFSNYIAAIIATNSAQGRWFDLRLPNVNGSQAKSFLKAGINWSRGVASTAFWETQMGEYCIDTINEANFPDSIKVSGRDYTKRCMNSKIEHAEEYAPNTGIVDLIKALATNSGITKFRLPSDATQIGKTVSMERGTSRWDIMKEAAAAGNYEMYFDNEGYLVLRQYQDPSLSPSELVFKTGPDGNLVSYERSTNDSRLYNHVCVYGDPADGEESRLPYFGEAINTEPSSPTRVARIGDRFYSFASQFFTSDQQCQDYAVSLLKITALESYDMNFSSIYYPWLEAGVICEVLDPDATEVDPTRFLISTIDFPIDLGPMGMTAKRVTYVGDSGN